MNAMRKVRCDAILHGLPAAQRQKVDGWLFDKGLTYQAVAQACGSVFGVKVSKSSVARYHERRMREELRRKRNATVARQTEGLNEEERYEALLAKLSDLAMEAAEELKAEGLNTRQGWRRIVQITRVLIAARRERNQRMRAELERMKFEMKSAAACLKHVRFNAKTQRRKNGRGMQGIGHERMQRDGEPSQRGLPGGADSAQPGRREAQRELERRGHFCFAFARLSPDKIGVYRRCDF